MFHHTLLITKYFHRFCNHHQVYKSMKYTIICHTEYREPFNVIKNVSNIEYPRLHNFAVYSWYSCNATLMVMTYVSDTYW